ncbi:MAG: helix-turn-helix domain-containing protein [Chloroflexota bacterium]|nr:helix-turn-helix domain-containing protein [Chloroflexota bacterium]
MEDLRVAALLRAVRLRRAWRQQDVGLRASVDQTTISLIERGLFERLTLGKLRQVAAALEVQLPFEPRWRGGESARLLDRAHASLVESAVRVLRSGDWTVTVEYTFNHYGERGSVDLVGWHATTRTLLLVEVKSRLLDVQDLVSTLDRKVRVVPQLLARERGWRATALERVVVLPETSGQRKAVARHVAVFSSAFPARTGEVRRWLLGPDGSLAGVWFLPDTTAGRGKQELAAARRVRRRSNGGPERESRRPAGRTSA